MATAVPCHAPPLDPALGRGAMRWVERKSNERTGLLAMPRLTRGWRADELSRAALAAWRQRWWRGEEGRDRRLGHYALAASHQAASLERLSEIRLSIMPLGAARGTTPKVGAFWQPGEPKVDRWLATLPLFELVDGALIAIDMLAWYLAEPTRWWSRTGAIEILGETRLADALRDFKPVRLYRTPQSWNRAGGPGAPGACILNWDGNIGMECRAFARALVGDNLAHARELQRLVDKRRPRVQFVTTGRSDTAA
jgi:hypothetical protein